MSTGPAQMPSGGRAVFSATIVLFAAWLVFHLSRFTTGPNGAVCLLLGLFLAVLIFLRPKPDDRKSRAVPGWMAMAAGVGGLGLLVAGRALPAPSLEWIGLLLVAGGILCRAVPVATVPDLLLALAVLYWIHPLPEAVVGPLESAVQRLSVEGAERLLHGLSMPAWADAGILRTATRAVDVTGADSGRKTAAAVLLCSLGIGILRRMRWYEVILFSVAGPVQGFLLEVVRISVAARIGATRAPEWIVSFLHRTPGILLLAAVGLLVAEAALWDAWKQRNRRRRALIEAGDDVGEPEDRARMLPTFWRWVRAWAWIGWATFALGVPSAWLVYKSLPHHRAKMIRKVAEGLVLFDLANAERAVWVGLSVEPGNDDLETLRLRILFQQKRYEDVLRALAARPPGGNTDDEQAMAARCLFVQKRYDEALAVLDRLSPEAQAGSAVAMMRAEFGVVHDQPAVVAANAVQAARWHGLADRIRALFPYLASREQWQAIVDSDMDLPYRTPVQALAAVNANLHRNRVSGAADAMRRAMATWPDDPLFLDSLLALAILRPGGDWERQFRRSYDRNEAALDRDTLGRLLDAGFVSARPELVWPAYRRLVASESPGADVLPLAETGEAWLTFRHRFLAMGGLRALCRTTRSVEPWGLLWRQVPLPGEALAGLPADQEAGYLPLCLEQLRRREQAGTLTPRMERMFPGVLAGMGRMAEAHTRVREMETKHPDDADAWLTERARLYAREGRWQDAYEAWRGRFARQGLPSLRSWMQYGDVLIHLNLGLHAMALLEQGLETFPESDALRATLSDLWGVYGFPDESLLVLGWPKKEMTTDEVACRLYESGRIAAARRLARAAARTEEFPDRPQEYIPPPAERAATWTGPSFSPEEYARGAELLPATTGVSPFLEGLARLKADWFRQKGTGVDIADPERWRGVGRDVREQASALHTLAVLLGRQGRLPEACDMARRTTSLMPRSRIAWRVYVALSNGDPAVVREARQRCPADSELWLADLVVRFRSQGRGTWALSEVEQAARQRTYTPVSFVRAGDFFLRHGMEEAAAACARHASRDGGGLLSAHVLGLGCALAQTNRAWALDCIRAASEEAVDPWPFHVVLVDLRGGERQGANADMVQALERLSARFPDDPRWVARLGEVYFRRGETARALGVLAPEIHRRGAAAIGVRSALLAAEAARREGELERSVRILETVVAANPGNADALNNLIYSLVQEDSGQSRAAELLPRLLAAPETAERLDTAALVALRCGQSEKAAEYMQKALQRIPPDAYGWHEIYLNAAEIQLARGSPDAVRPLIEKIRTDTRRTPAVESRAREILRRARAASEPGEPVASPDAAADRPTGFKG